MLRPAAEVCHDEQLQVWASEIIDVLIDHLHPGDFEDVVDIHVSLRGEIKRIVGDAFGMAETDP